MTDRELLEMAAKAAGIAVVWGKWLNRHEWLVHYNTGDLSPWNPLTDDGDALRLAVKLHMDIWQCPLLRSVSIICDSEDVIKEKYEGDPQTATRRAIVRAAAEIGRGME